MEEGLLHTCSKTSQIREDAWFVCVSVICFIFFFYVYAHSARMILDRSMSMRNSDRAFLLEGKYVRSKEHVC